MSSQQRSTVASMMHRQETVECLKKFNARRKLKVRPELSIFFGMIVAVRAHTESDDDLICRVKLQAFFSLEELNARCSNADAQCHEVR